MDLELHDLWYSRFTAEECEALDATDDGWRFFNMEDLVDEPSAPTMKTTITRIFDDRDELQKWATDWLRGEGSVNGFFYETGRWPNEAKHTITHDYVDEAADLCDFVALSMGTWGTWNPSMEDMLAHFDAHGSLTIDLFDVPITAKIEAQH